MKYLFLFLISLPAFATHMHEKIKSFGQKGDEVMVTFSSQERVHRMPASAATVPCLEDAWKARMPVDVDVNDQNGDIIYCKLGQKGEPTKAKK